MADPKLETPVTKSGYQIGDRVGAIASADKEEVYIFGYGQYMGDVVPPPEITFMGLSLAELGHTNPKILLDSGKVVWGCECWWGPEDKIKASIGSRKVTELDIEQERINAKQTNPK
jgi:hypothetical protein